MRPTNRPAVRSRRTRRPWWPRSVHTGSEASHPWRHSIGESNGLRHRSGSDPRFRGNTRRRCVRGGRRRFASVSRRSGSTGEPSSPPRQQGAGIRRGRTRLHPDRMAQRADDLAGGQVPHVSALSANAHDVFAVRQRRNPRDGAVAQLANRHSNGHLIRHGRLVRWDANNNERSEGGDASLQSGRAVDPAASQHVPRSCRGRRHAGPS